MFRPPFLARVAAGAAVYALEETRRLPTTALNLPITAASQMLQNFMHLQQFVTSLALKGDEVFDRLTNRPEEQPEWATFDEDSDDEQTFGTASESARTSRFDLYSPEDSAAAIVDAAPESAEIPAPEVAEISQPTAEDSAITAQEAAISETSEASETSAPERTEVSEPVAEAAATPAETSVPATASVASTNGRNGSSAAIVEPEVATRYDYLNMTLAQLRARLRMLSVDELAQLLSYEQQTQARAPFLTMLTNRIATVKSK
ncbi:lipid droplet-associated protein [Nocardia uniformis]|uniref:Lipid droplet-associated protein n=1 Tax=Nocardia uniformis TaxID=53432 RepID=A0A849BXT7_9NOCA|nr:lipid droplet-associated protein [Nocardia uniformis]NNH69886.1 lipid droplet-associated protein [Nocardia uniformis]